LQHPPRLWKVLLPPTPQSTPNGINGYEKALALWRQQLGDGLNITKVPQNLDPPLSAQTGQAKGEWAECLKSSIPSCNSGSAIAKKRLSLLVIPSLQPYFPWLQLRWIKKTGES